MTVEPFELADSIARGHAGDAVPLPPTATPRSSPIPNILISAYAEPACHLRHRRASMRRDGAGADQGHNRNLALPRALSGLCTRWRTGPWWPGALPRIFERAVPGRLAP